MDATAAKAKPQAILRAGNNSALPGGESQTLENRRCARSPPAAKRLAPPASIGWLSALLPRQMGTRKFFSKKNFRVFETFSLPSYISRRPGETVYRESHVTIFTIAENFKPSQLLGWIPTAMLGGVAAARFLSPSYSSAEAWAALWAFVGAWTLSLLWDARVHSKGKGGARFFVSELIRQAQGPAYMAAAILKPIAMIYQSKVGHYDEKLLSQALLLAAICAAMLSVAYASSTSKVKGALPFSLFVGNWGYGVISWMLLLWQYYCFIFFITCFSLIYHSANGPLSAMIGVELFLVGSMIFFLSGVPVAPEVAAITRRPRGNPVLNMPVESVVISNYVNGR